MREITVTCSYIPLEIILAAGYTPVKLSTISNNLKECRECSSYICSYALNVFNNLISNERIDGVIFTNSCHAMENVYEMLKEKRPDLKSFILSVPRKNNDISIKFFTDELIKLKKFVENVALFQVTDELLLSEIKKRVEYYSSTKTASVFGLQKNEEDKKILKRIIISGSVCSPLDIVSVVNAYGGNVVYSDTCDNRIPERYSQKSNDPIEILSRAYLEKPHCSRMIIQDEKYNHISKLINQYNADGVIYSLVSFCPDQTFNVAETAVYLKNNNIPFLILDNEYTANCSGQIQTRIQAFLEML